MSVGAEIQAAAHEIERAGAFSRIVVAVDGSEASRKAAAFAASLAARSRASLQLLHVAETPEEDASSVRADLDVARRRFAEERARTGGAAPGGEPVAAFRRGSPAREIVALARECGADLIVTGTRSAPGKARLLAGSVAGEVLRLARGAVLVVPEDAAVPEPGAALFERPLVAVDYSDPSRAALRAAARAVEHAPLDVLHALPENGYGRELLAVHDRARDLAAARASLDAWVRDALDGLGRRATARVTIGMPPAAIVDVAVGAAHDLVACGSRRHALSGCVAEALLDTVACPVLVHRGEAATEVKP